MTEHIAITDQDGVRIVAMRRPAKKNALTQEMYLAMTGALDGASADDASLVIERPSPKYTPDWYRKRGGV